MTGTSTDTLWTRRQFLALSAGALATASVRATPLPYPEVRSRMTGADLYRNAFVLDCNTLASIGLLAKDANFADELAAIRASGVDAVKSTLGDADGSFEATVADIAAAQAMIERNPAAFLKIRTAADLDRCKPEGKLGVIFSFEAASMLGDQPTRIDVFRNLDVLIMQLSYNHDTPFGHGCLDGEAGGVTALGRDAIARMNALGVALDLSHSNTRTTAEGIALSRKPPIVTHAGCRAVFMHPRNKRDEEMRALADKGGVMGIYMLPFLTPDTRQPMLADYMQHMLHALKVCGEDHVGIGTDTAFFTVTDKDLAELQQEMDQRKRAGVGSPGENRPPYLPDVNTPRKLEHVAGALLQAGYGGSAVDKVLGGNFRRVLGEIWTA